MKLLKVLSLEAAIESMVRAMADLNWRQTEFVPLEEALGRILAVDLIARDDIPGFRRSTMDGYAVHSRATHGAAQGIPTILEIVEEIEMGAAPQKSITASEASIIYTGGMLPDGADAVVPIEETEQMGETLVAVYKPVATLAHVVDIGEDTRAGTCYFKAGTRVTPHVVAGAASLGYLTLEVYVPPRVRILSTGDEILPPDAELTPGKTRDVNSFALVALCQELGLEVVAHRHLPDVEAVIRGELTKDDVDIIVVSGSSSKGAKDFVPGIIEKDFEPGMLFHGIAIKPGKPTSLGSDGRKLILGLPGHPVSAIAVFRAVFAPAFRRHFGLPEPRQLPCRISQSMAASPGRTCIQLVSLEACGDGWRCHPIFGASGNLSTLAGADGYFVISQQQEGVEKDQCVDVTLFAY